MKETIVSTSDKTDINNINTKQVGWICPVCNSGVAPWVTKCPCISGVGYLPYVVPVQYPYIPAPIYPYPPYTITW